VKFSEMRLDGVYLIEMEPVTDERGFFARTWCQREFKEHGLNPQLVQCSVSFNTLRGTVRGMHYQDEPHAETKVVRCTRGALFDALIDLRPNSPSFRQWIGVELTADNRRMLYVPPGIAHGFQTLEDNTEVAYQISEFHHPECAKGVRWDDPAFGLTWPEPVRIIAPRDQRYPDFEV